MVSLGNFYKFITSEAISETTKPLPMHLAAGFTAYFFICLP